MWQFLVIIFSNWYQIITSNNSAQDYSKRKNLQYFLLFSNHENIHFFSDSRVFEVKMKEGEIRLCFITVKLTYNQVMRTNNWKGHRSSVHRFSDIPEGDVYWYNLNNGIHINTLKLVCVYDAEQNKSLYMYYKI